MTYSSQGRFSFAFFLNERAPTEIYPLSLHAALPIAETVAPDTTVREAARIIHESGHNRLRDRKSTRLNSSHGSISYAVFSFDNKKAGYADQPPFGRHILSRCHNSYRHST